MIKDINKLIDEISKNPHIFFILLSGSTGSGKTHFVKEYMKVKYAFNKVSSPTYTTCNTYSINEITIKHFDFDIRANISELEIAIENTNLIFIEWWNKWPEVIQLLKHYNNVSFEINCNE